MVNQDERPVDSVQPTAQECEFMQKIIERTAEYARSKRYNDMIFQGHSDQRYFGAYQTHTIRQGKGIFIFGFERRGSELRFAFPGAVPEPKKLSVPWTSEETRKRSVIVVQNPNDKELLDYLTGVAKRSIDYTYSTRATPGMVPPSRRNFLLTGQNPLLN